MTQKVFLVAAEPSGDAFAAEIVDALRQGSDDIAMAAIGGEELAARGLSSPLDTTPLSIVGLLDGLKVYPDVIRLADAATEAIIDFAPDQVLLVDSWGFMIRVAERLQSRGFNGKVVKVIGPQVWATRPGRAGKLAKVVDAILCIHAFEQPFYEGLDVETQVIGNPALGRNISGDATRARMSLRIDESASLVTVLPGSRGSEIRRVAPALLDTAAALVDANADLQIVLAPASSVATAFDPGPLSGHSRVHQVRGEQGRYDAIAASDLVLACSGTVTTETALLETPMIVAYKLGWITWAVARSFLFKAKYITLLNTAAGREIAPEFVQTRCKAEHILPVANALLGDAAGRAQQVKDQNKALQSMGVGEEPAATRVARYVLR